MPIPDVVAAGQQWKEVWEVDGNNADGIIATNDGGLLIAQNDKSDVVKLDKNGKASVAYTGTNTGGSLAINSKGALFVANRGLNPSIEELAPQRKALADRKTLYAVARDNAQNKDWIIALPMIAQGPKGRGK